MCFCELPITFSSLSFTCIILTLQKQYTLFFASCFLVVEKFMVNLRGSEMNYEYWEMILLTTYMYIQMKTNKNNLSKKQTVYETLTVLL